MKKIAPSIFIILFVLLALVNIAYSQCGPANAIYVAPNGTGTGTAASPAGLESAITMYRNNPTRNPLILLEGFYYPGNTLKLPSGIAIEGGYINSNGSWQKSPTAVSNVRVYNPQFQFATINDGGQNFMVGHIIGIQLDSVENIKLTDFNLEVATGQGVAMNNRCGTSVYGIHAYKSKNVQIMGMK
ncbi:MAG TPA: hypothetical protein VK174_10975, partial [Chitinophagales bacterium]|nr:hypothetical protein [Chitinophagales bacterium]